MVSRREEHRSDSINANAAACRSRRRGSDTGIAESGVHNVISARRRTKRAKLVTDSFKENFLPTVAASLGLDAFLRRSWWRVVVAAVVGKRNACEVLWRILGRSQPF